MIARIVAWLIGKNLSVSVRTILVNAVIHSLEMPPTRAIISKDESRRILVQGKPLSEEQAALFLEGAYALTTNPAQKLIRDQVRFMAVDRGFLQSSNPETQLFYKAALWYAQTEQELVLELLS
jgi:hypothetical protein